MLFQIECSGRILQYDIGRDKRRRYRAYIRIEMELKMQSDIFWMGPARCRFLDRISNKNHNFFPRVFITKNLKRNSKSITISSIDSPEFPTNRRKKE